MEGCGSRVGGWSLKCNPSDGSFVEVGPEHGPLCEPSQMAHPRIFLARFLHNLPTASVSMSRQNYPSTVSRAEIPNSLEATLMMGASEFGIPKCARSRQDISIPTENTAMGKERII